MRRSKICFESSSPYACVSIMAHAKLLGLQAAVHDREKGSHPASTNVSQSVLSVPSKSTCVDAFLLTCLWCPCLWYVHPRDALGTFKPTATRPSSVVPLGWGACRWSCHDGSERRRRRLALWKQSLACARGSCSFASRRHSRWPSERCGKKQDCFFLCLSSHWPVRNLCSRAIDTSCHVVLCRRLSDCGGRRRFGKISIEDLALECAYTARPAQFTTPAAMSGVRNMWFDPVCHRQKME